MVCNYTAQPVLRLTKQGLLAAENHQLGEFYLRIHIFRIHLRGFSRHSTASFGWEVATYVRPMYRKVQLLPGSSLTAFLNCRMADA